MLITAFDTETTGLDRWHGCRPFMIQFLTNKSDRPTVYRWRVNGRTREVTIPNSEKLEISNLIQETDILVGHNVKFDLGMLEVAGISLPENIWDKVHDTIIASHVLHSAGPHGLKELGLKWLDILDTDEKDLNKAAIKARAIGQRVGWRIAADNDPHWPTQKNKSWSKADYWIPGELYRLVQDYDVKGEIPANIPLEQIDWVRDRIDPQWGIICETYGIRDVERTLCLYVLFQKIMEEQELGPQYRVRMGTVRRCYEMETRGLTFRKFLGKAVADKHGGIAHKHKQQAINYVSCLGGTIDNLDSHPQLSAAMYDILKMPIVSRTETGKPSTDKDTIAELKFHVRPQSIQAHFLANLLGYRKRHHAETSVLGYLAGSLPYQDGRQHCFARLHSNLNPTGTDTTRFSGDNPNPQNIAKGENLPKEEKFNLRDLFGPHLGRRWFSHDYSNQEMRIFAYSAEERSLIEAFEKDESVHLIIAAELYPKEFDECVRTGESFKDKYKSTLYQWVKNGNFALIYGAGEKRADATYHLKGAYKRIRSRFKNIDRFMSIMNRQAKERGFITCLGGYRLVVPSGAPHKAVNYFVQGSAGWAMALSINRIGEYLDSLWDTGYPEHYMLMTIHDELLHDVPINHIPSFPYDIKNLMELAGKDLGMPLPVEMSMIRTSWDQPEDVPPQKVKKLAPPAKRIAI